VIVSFDVDGVIAATTPADFNPNRNHFDYYNKPPHPSLNLATLNRIIARDQVYFITARSFPKALITTRKWLMGVGVNVEDSMGVLVAEGTRGHDHRGSDTKHAVVNWLGSRLHIDDHPDIIERLGAKGLLFKNEQYAGNVLVYDSPGHVVWKADNWADIEQTIERIRNAEGLT
jgi:hypothetical protein